MFIFRRLKERCCECGYRLFRSGPGHKPTYRKVTGSNPRTTAQLCLVLIVSCVWSSDELLNVGSTFLLFLWASVPGVHHVFQLLRFICLNHLLKPSHISNLVLNTVWGNVEEEDDDIDNELFNCFSVDAKMSKMILPSTQMMWFTQSQIAVLLYVPVAVEVRPNVHALKRHLNQWSGAAPCTSAFLKGSSPTVMVPTWPSDQEVLDQLKQLC